MMNLSISCVDLNNIKSDQDEDGRVIPLLLENKPPVREDAMDTSEIPDLHMRPEPVRELTSHTLNVTYTHFECSILLIVIEYC